MGTDAYCMFCDSSPCTCSSNISQKKKASRPAKKSTQKTAPRSLASGTQQSLPAPPPPLPSRQGLVSTLTIEEMDYRSCVRALELILASESKQEVAHILNSKPGLEERVYSWKKEYRVEKERHA